jgi:hypothetical protein
MKTEERELIQSLLAPLTVLPATLTAALAPLGALPDAVRALARAQGGEQSTLDPASQVTAQEVARIAGIEPVWGETLFQAVRRALALREHDARLGVREALDHTMEELAKYTGIELQDGDTIADVIRRAGLATADARAWGDQHGRGQALVELSEAGGFELVGADVRGREFEVIANYVRMGREFERSHGARPTGDELSEMYASGAREGRGQVWRAAGMDEDAPRDALTIVEAIQERASARLIIEKERAEQRVQELQAELDVRFAEGCEQGRAERATELEQLQDWQHQLHEEARNQTVHELVARSGHPAVGAHEALDVLAAAIRDGIESGSSLREVRERAAQGALLALLDERCPGARHERVGLGKVEDLAAVELRAEVARRWHDTTPGYAAGRAMIEDEGDHAWADGLLRKSEQIVVAGLESLLGEAPDGDLEQLCSRLSETAQANASTLREVERDLRTALNNAGVPADADVLQCAELLVLVASRNHNAAQKLDEANEYIGAIDAELRRFLQACGEKLSGQERVLDLAHRLADAGQRTVVEVPRSARDGARRELREIVSALGLTVATDHLAVPDARAAVIAAIQAQMDPDARPLEQFREVMAALCDVVPDANESVSAVEIAQEVVRRARWESASTVAQRTLLQLREKLGVAAIPDVEPGDVVSAPDQAVDNTARAIREHYVNLRHEDLARGQQLVIDAVSTTLSVPKPLADQALQNWAAEIVGGWVATSSTASVGADTSSEQRASVLAAVEALGGELPSEPTLGEACMSLDSRIAVLKVWAKDYLPILALWDRLAIQECPLAFERVKRGLDSKGVENPARDVRDAHEDAADWNPLARDLRAVVEGDDPSALAQWLKTGQDARALIEVALDRVKHLEDVCAESDDAVENAKVEIVERVEDLARALYERTPVGVDPQLVARTAEDLADVSDPLVNGVRSLLAGAADRASAPRDLDAWCALHPTERNRLIDRTRDALAAVAA